MTVKSDAENQEDLKLNMAQIIKPLCWAVWKSFIENWRIVKENCKSLIKFAVCRKNVCAKSIFLFHLQRFIKNM